MEGLEETVGDRKREGMAQKKENEQDGGHCTDRDLCMGQRGMEEN